MTSCVLKLPLQVDPENANLLDGQSRICNWLYNQLLAKAQELKTAYRNTQDPQCAKTIYTERGLRNLIPAIKAEHPFLKVVHSSPLKNAALRVSESIRRHQQSKKQPTLVNWPKFRSWKKKWFSLFYDEPKKGFRIEGKMLILSLGMGQDRKRRSIALSLPEASLLQDKAIRNLRINFELGTYYAVFTIQKDLPQTQPIRKVIALDPNHKNLAYGVDTNGNAIEIKPPQWLKSYDKRLDELKAKRDRCERKSRQCNIFNDKGEPTGKYYYLPSKKWAQMDRTLQRALKKRREQTKTFLYTTSHQLYREYDHIAIGDYTPDGSGETTSMRRAMNNRSLIGRFKATLHWVAQKSGKTFQEYDEKGTTRTCRHCQYVEGQGIPLAQRQWRCQQCEAIHIRDENAAINGLGKVLRDLPQKYETKVSIVSGSDLVVQQRWAWRVLPSGVVTLPQGQNREEIHSARKLNRERGSLRSKVGHLII